MSIKVEVFTSRQKLRRLFETEFREINKSIQAAAKVAGVEPFFIKYSDHLLDRAIQRDIDESYVFKLFKRLHNHVADVNQFLNMTPYPEVESEVDLTVEYRPMRLEITDGTLWLGMTVDRKLQSKCFSLKCRMAFINNKRLKGKISTKVINV